MLIDKYVRQQQQARELKCRSGVKRKTPPRYLHEASRYMQDKQEAVMHVMPTTQAGITWGSRYEPL
jgi:hypothetical protein